ASRPGRLRVVEGDVRDDGALAALFRNAGPARLVHAAAVTAGEEREARDPQSIVSVNVGGTAAVLQAAQHNRVGRIVCLSSGSAYGESLFGAGPLHEEATPARPATLYGITKFAAEKVALRLRALWGLDLACARLGSVFGPWEYGSAARDHVSAFMQLACCAATGRPALLPPNIPRKDWIYARDVGTGIVALLEAGAPAHALYNLGAGCDWHGAIAAWCARLQSVYNGFEHRTANPGERVNVSFTEPQDRALMDTGRIAADIGFRAGYPPQRALDDFADWLRRIPRWPQYGGGKHE
ncbi:MAG TPA: NAD(P)-dependent oxidoreductase, partial [Burkholderiales bacterium]|nr:NAD(P)-dependent oxidoreductase [Burkholderiales bacterium]